jgi:hypothetical protein
VSLPALTPARRPTSTSSFYVGNSNGTIVNTPDVPGKVFDRFIQIWLENTDFAQAAGQAVFQNLSSQGITLSSYYGVTHPSEPNYIAACGGDFWGLSSDNLVDVPTNISTIVDLLDLAGVSWSSYQENIPSDGYPGFNFTNPDGYTYYVRKHNPLVIYDSVGLNSTRAARIRNFNDFAVDVSALLVVFSFPFLRLISACFRSTTTPCLNGFSLLLIFASASTYIALFPETQVYIAMLTIPPSSMLLIGLPTGWCHYSRTRTSTRRKH